ncbi:MAG TPA: hypothetical protein DDZ51_12510 [Planctomycetaceae bacterium]|nr:hypothetical protein [Planctomycetaceae bacterium]
MNRVMSETANANRLRVFHDTDVELPLAIRYVILGLACGTYFSFMLVCNQWVQMPDATIQDFFLCAIEDATYWLPGFFLLAPLAFHDFVKSCGRVSKPIARLRNEMALLNEHRSERPIEIRDGEAWPEVLAHFNQLRGELLTLRREVSEYEAMLGNASVSELNQSPKETAPVTLPTN